MWKHTKKVLPAILAIPLAFGGAFVSNIQAAEADSLKQGKKLSYDRKKGNCLACHMMGDGVSPGNIGPALIAMKARFPNKSALRDQLWDATVANPNTRMPPFGKNRILTEAEIDLVLDYLYSL